MRRFSRSPSASDRQLGLFHPAHQPLRVREEKPLYALAVYRVTLVRETSVQVPSAQIRTAHDAAALFRPYLAGVDREHVVVGLLNRKHHAIGLNTVSIGSLKASIVGIREVLCAVR